MNLEQELVESCSGDALEHTPASHRLELQAGVSTSQSLEISQFYAGAQLSLLDAQTIGAPHNGTETSILAAQSIAAHVSPMQQRILDYISSAGPSTEEEISLGADMRLSSVCARVNELVHQKYLLADSGLKRRTSSGRLAVIWELSPSPASLADTGLQPAPEQRARGRELIEGS